MRNLENITEDVRKEIINNALSIAKTMKGMFGLMYRHKLYEDDSYLREERNIAKYTLDILNNVASDSEDEDVKEAKAYLNMILRS